MKEINNSTESSFPNLKHTPPKFNKISKKEIEFQNMIAHKRGALPFEFDQQHFHFRLNSISSEHSIDIAEIWIKLLFNQNFFWVGFNKYSFGLLAGNCFLFDSLENQPTEIQNALVESTLDTFLSATEHSISSRIDIDTVALMAPELGNSRTVFFTLDQNETPNANSYFAFEESLSPVFLKILENLPDSKPHKWDPLQTTLRFQIGLTRLNVEELQELRCNDLIFIDDCPFFHDHSISIHIIPNLVCKGILKDNKLVINTTMTEIKKAENKNVVDIDELQIDLVFDVGEKTIPLQELKKIQPGYIFELDKLMTSPVTIRANGQAIGTGELLEVDEKIAIRVLGLNQQSNG
jgi:type III secretion system YscQ/HrcQ family protein